MGFLSGILDSVKDVAGGLIDSVSGGDILGLAGGILGSKGQSSANAQNVALSREQMEFQERMSSTAHQREVADLKAAGLNPMLSGMGGSGASSPAGTMAKVENSAASASQGVLNVASSRLLKAQTATAETQAGLNAAQTAKTVEEARRAAADANVAEFESKSVGLLGDREIDSRTKEIDARFARAVTARFRESNDFNSIQALNEEARKAGYPTIDAAMVSNEFRQKVNDLYQSKLLNAEKESFSDMYKTEYGKSVAPYVNSASNAVGAAAGAARAVSSFRRPSIIRPSLKGKKP